MRISTKDKIDSIVMHRSNMRCNAVSHMKNMCHEAVFVFSCAPLILYVADCMDKYLVGNSKNNEDREFDSERKIKMAKKDERFEKIYSQGSMNGTEIWVDKVTGVNYLFHYSGYAGGLTPLLDREGKPVISSIRNGSDII